MRKGRKLAILAGMTRLSVNLNKVALLRNQRDIGYPDLLAHARLVLDAGAGGITVHPRPDERHVRRADVPLLSRFVQEWGDAAIEYNIEGYPDDDFINLVLANHCHQVTLVPDAPGQKTSDHGWDLPAATALLRPVITKLRGAGRRVSLFIDPDPALPALAMQTGADAVELYTGPYAFDAALLPRYRETAETARDIGLHVNAGHDLNLDNLGAFIAAVPFCAEVSIGHAITDDALKYGWAGAIARYNALLKPPSA